MGLKRDLTDFEKGMIVGARRSGLSVAKTVKLFGFSKAAISRVYNEWARTQNTSSKRMLCGRRPLVDERGRLWVAQALTINRQFTVEQLTSEYNCEVQRPISLNTMRRTLACMGYNSRRPRRVPLLSIVNRQRRLQWAKTHQQWTVDDWKKVVWSDESQFQLHHHNGRARVWRKQHEAMDPSFMVKNVEMDEGCVKIWGMLSWHALGSLIPVDENLEAPAYLNILGDQVHPFMTIMYPKGDGYFQQDNTSCHGATSVCEWFEEHSSEMSIMTWPPQSPDISPVEHLWDELEHSMCRRECPPSNLEQLREALISAWSSLTPEHYRNHIESLPRQVAAIIRAKGGPTWY
uniref:Transposase Tc1-like domain-containing protein n=1 Tax=Electrophorus electricus TaxID=8005 RepID=A0AAY5F1C5_ELEEL